MVKTRTSRDQADLPGNEEPPRPQTTSKNEHQKNGFQSDSSHEEQFMSRKRRRSYHEDSEDSSLSIRHRLRRVRRIQSPSMRSTSHRYYERESLKLRTRSRNALGIRRSTRKKKLRYETYDQNLIDKQFSMMDRDSDDEISEQEISTRRRPKQTYISHDEELDDDEEDDEEEEEENDKVKAKSRRISDDTSEKHNDEELDENKASANREEAGRSLRKGRKRAEVVEEEIEDIEQPKRSHRRLEVEPMPEAEALDMYTRVKRERPRVKRDMYGIPINDDEKDDKSTSDSETEIDNSDEDTDDDDDDERNKDKTTKKKSYNLRLHCRKTNLYTAPPIEPQRSYRRSIRSLGRSFQSLGSSTEDFRSSIRRRRKRAAFHSSTSSSSATDDEDQFERRKSKSMAKARQRCLPMNLTAEDVASGVIRDRAHSGASLADVEPMAIDRSVLFDSIGGLGKHLQALKEMIVFPLIYPEVFTRFKITPPRGVLFHGPPGTGKTLVARALANECSQGDTKVAFFMRKGADCLSKWVGESERQLRLLFDQAYQMRPAIIFFDEIDGLAPVRSSRQDQIHSSIVSTLLALMDGLDDRGEVVVIGATNRIDSIDPALRRPGRFDREFLFPLPTLEARKQILQIHTKEWKPPLPTDFVVDLARRTVGYCGADLKALCTEAALHALRRRYPQIYNSRDKLLIDVSSINICSLDFYHGMDRIMPTSQRSASSPAKALGEIVRPLLQTAFGQAIGALQRIFPSAFSGPGTPGFGDDDYSDDDLGADVSNEGSSEFRTMSHQLSSSRFHPPTYRPRLLLTGDQGQGQSSHLGPALLHQMENLAVNVVDLPALLAVGTRTPEESCAQIFREARRSSPSILYLPHINELWDVIGDSPRATFLSLLNDLDPSVPVLLLATCETRFESLPLQVKELFRDEFLVVPEPDEAKRREFFEHLLLHQVSQPPVSRKKTERKVEVLPKAPKPDPRKLTEAEQERLYAQEETTLRELRLFLRDVINKLGRDRKFAVFAKPVEIEEVPDYYDIIKNPMALSTMMTRIDLHKYETVQQFLQDIDLICSNALEYNPDKDPQDRAIRHRACALKDTTNAIIEAELDPDFGKLCEDIAKARRNRNFSTKEVPVPSFYFTKPLDPSTSSTNNPADGSCSTRFGRRMGIQSTTEDNSGTGTTEVVTNADSKNNPDKDTSFPRKVVKRIRFCRTRKTTGFKSPWCRTSKPIYKKVIIYVDRNGKEIPESEYKKALDDSTLNVSENYENLKKECSCESAGRCTSDCSKYAGAEGSSGPASRCQGKRKSSLESTGDAGRLGNEISKVLPVSNNKSPTVNHISPPHVETSHVRTATDDMGLLPDKATSGLVAHDHQTRKAVQTLAKVLKTVVTDPSRQRNLLDEVVQKTRGFSVERLEKLYSQLSLCVYRHRNEYNKMQLLKDLENVIGNISTVKQLNRP